MRVTTHFLIQNELMNEQGGTLIFIYFWDHVACQNQTTESDDHRDHGGIGGSKNKYFFLIVFQRLMP